MCSDHETLAKRVEAGEVAAEQILCSELRPLVLRSLHRLGVERDLAEDLTQDSLILMLERLRAGEIQRRDSLAHFVRNTARNLLFANTRRERRRRDLLAAHHDCLMPDALDDAGTGVYEAETRQLVARVLDRLSIDRDRQILIQHYLVDRERSVIQGALGLAPENFDRVISRARQRARLNVSKDELSTALS